MADWLIIEGISPYDGRYEFSVDDITSRELGWIKRLAGTLPADLEAGLRGGDAELFCVLAVIALRRAGKVDVGDVPAVFDRLADGPYGAAITLDIADEEDADRPPLARPPVNGATSGAGSPTSSESPANGPSPTGIQGSAISESGRPTSVT